MASNVSQTVDMFNVQGDIWSRGFPKRFETYYLFTINGGDSNEKQFSQCLRKLTETTTEDGTPLLSTLAKVKDDHAKILERKREERNMMECRSDVTNDEDDHPVYPVANALIAFTSEGLNAIQRGFENGESLDMFSVRMTNPAFYGGMARPGIATKLNDPPSRNYDGPFNNPDIRIHGLLKIGGSSKKEVDDRLKLIQDTLEHGRLISDVAEISRIDGWTRPKPNRGKEHFGFQDHISQPLIDGIDDDEPEILPFSMKTDSSLLIVSEKTASEAPGRLATRPPWMFGGSFLVFRKLEQDVPAFEALTKKFLEYSCQSPGHMGAKLMGRWKSGAPIAMPAFHTNDSSDPKSAKLINNFIYGGDICPASAHIRKTNPRNLKQSAEQNFPRAPLAKIIRNGIPYGSDYNGDPADTSKRGLLFACYQSHIEDGFEQMQVDWANSEIFPEADTGLDPIIGQVGQSASGTNGNLDTFITTNTTDTEKGKNNTKSVSFRQFVTMRGGGYFFVPSISALHNDLGQA
ncbi:Dyp-type peroxidase [Amniculicola lignicola CBS 123094]|uniref:Dyp-type peroxidase n=1 Tax=Amniculicola lignicola CBS 123094 TaxID=1392246 RepID=A0A6A5WHC4_9PLEO|nr:Dyp-type peroxidase [Amniculicola lignicola CBS 123094]